MFVSLGIKGADKTVGAMSNVKKGLGEIGSTSLEVKAGILAAMYGLERMMAISGAAGTGFQNFAALTGMSIDKLQEWQNAARQAGVSSDEMAGSLKGVQNTMTNMALGKGAPELFARIAQASGGIDQSKYKDTFYMMDKLQTAMRNLSVEEGNVAGKSMGLTEGTIAAMRRNMFRPENFKIGGKYSEGESKSLDKSNIAWANLEKKIEMAFGHFNAKHGQSLVGDLSKMVDEVLRLAEAFERLSDKIKLFDIINEVFKGWGIIFDGISSGVDKLMSMMGKGGDDKDLTDKKGNLKKNPVSMLSNLVGSGIDGYFNMKDQSAGLVVKHAPPAVANSGHLQSVTHATTVNQNITHHGDAKDTKPVGDLHRHAVRHAYNQRAAQRQGP